MRGWTTHSETRPMPAAPDVKDVFLAAAERPATDRAAYLDAACAGDADLRRRVEALLKAHDEPDSAPAEGPGTASFGATAPPAEQRGDRVGPYKLLQLIGEGGMGTVWMAEQTE